VQTQSHLSLNWLDPAALEAAFFKIAFGGFVASWLGALLAAGADYYVTVMPAAEMQMASGETKLRLMDMGVTSWLQARFPR
jgi:hypothetical protein